MLIFNFVFPTRNRGSSPKILNVTGGQVRQHLKAGAIRFPCMGSGFRENCFQSGVHVMTKRTRFKVLIKILLKMTVASKLWFCRVKMLSLFSTLQRQVSTGGADGSHLFAVSKLYFFTQFSVKRFV